ncbi:MAG: HPr family phosphocarrier protein [Butyricicoccaceae bacterium]
MTLKTKVKIRIKDIKDIVCVSDAAAKMPFDIDLAVGHYIIDAKSTVGMLSLLNIKKAIRVVMYATEEEARPFLNSIGPLIVAC